VARVGPDIATTGVPGRRRWSEPDEPSPKQPVNHPATHRRLQLVTQRPAARDYIRSEQTFDGSERTGGVAVVKAGADVHEICRVPVCLVDGAQARQCGTAQRDQQLLAANLFWVMVKRDEQSVHHPDSVPGTTTTLDEARIR
jgi:hypothetical protein